MGLFGINWKQALMGIGETALNIGASMIPGGSMAKRMAKKALKGLSRGVGVTKDLLSGGGGFPDMGEFSKNFDDKIRKGVDEAKEAVEAQGKALRGAMNGMKSELEGQLKQQGEKFDQEIKDLNKQIANATGAVKKEAEDRRKALQAQKQELESKINEVTEQLTKAQNQLRKELDEFRNEVDERFAEQEQKILENKRKIEEERIKREEEVREINDKIKLSNTNLENLRKEKEQLEDDIITHKAQVSQQTAETQQAFEDAQAEYERRTKIIETQIEDNQETIQEFSEQLNNFEREQARQKLEQEEILENLQEQSDILFTQQHKLNLVSQQMEEIHEEVHERMDKLSQKLDERTNETLNIAKDTSKKVDKLTTDIEKMRDDLENLEEQVQKNKKETEKAKQEAKLANERLDNLLKTQALMDFSSEQSNLDKIQKSLELKAEETKLIATLNLLQETKKLVQIELSEIDWKVGIEKGTEKDLPREEGMPLNPNSSWAKKYTPEQLREWGWDTRLLGEHEKAPLTDEDKRKEKQAQNNEQESKVAGEENSLAQDTIEKIEQLKTETLERLAAIQQEIRTGLEEIENTQNASAKPSKPFQTKLQTIQEEIRKKKSQLDQKEQKVANLENKPYSVKSQKKIEQAQKEQEKAKKELEQAQAQLDDPSFQFEQEIEQYEEKQAEEKQEEVKKQWQTIQALSKQALQEQPEEEQEEKEQKEHDTNKPLEELVQQLKEMEQVQAASQKTMTYAMLFLIIFLMEYVVYKKNGLPGLVVLNIILLICYWYKDKLMEYADLFGKYLLIIGYVMGNVLAYNSVENPDYKWPMVIGFNAIIALIYGYTLWQQKKEEAEREAFYRKQTKEICQELNIPEELLESVHTMVGEELIPANPFSSNIPTSQKAEHFQELVNQQLQEQAITKQKGQEIQQQAEVLQKAAAIEKNLAQAQEGLDSPRMTWNRIKELYPEFENKSILLSEFEKADKLLEKSTKNGGTQPLIAKLERLLVPSEEEQNLLSHLNLTLDQYISISLKTPYLIAEEKEFIINNYLNLNNQVKLQLLIAGLNNLEINTYEKKEKLVELVLTCKLEKEEFGLTNDEKKKVLELLINTINLDQKQKEDLKKMGVDFFDASSWKITEEQKDKILDSGLSRLKLTEEQKKQLTTIHPDQFKTFSLTGEQKNILNSLSPLIKENKYSEESLKLLKSLQLKPDTISFLVQEEIIPDSNTQFGTTKSSYLPLKMKFLEGEQRTLRKIKEEEEKKISEERIKEDKLSILRSLMNFAEGYGEKNWGKKEEDELSSEDENDDAPPGLKIDVFDTINNARWTQNHYDYRNGRELNTTDFLKKTFLKDYNFSLNQWVKNKVLTSWQADILLTCGFKTIPKYNFFELLIFAVEKFAGQSWADFLQANEDLTEEFDKYVRKLENQPITITTKCENNFRFLNLNFHSFNNSLNNV